MYAECLERTSNGPHYAMWSSCRNGDHITWRHVDGVTAKQKFRTAFQYGDMLGMVAVQVCRHFVCDAKQH